MRESLIRDIYFGNYDPKRCRPSKGEGGVSTFDEILAMRQQLLEELPEQYRGRVFSLTEACLSLLCEQSAEDFEEGYRLGVRLMIAALNEEMQK